MNTDLHGWDFQTQEGEFAADFGTANSNPLSDPCSIRVSSVAQITPIRKASTSLTMIVMDEEDNISVD
jgi:hypothetical protein